MIPFLATAHLSTPPVIDWPLMFDALLYGGMGARMGAAHPSGWVDPPDVTLLPLVRVGDPDGAWWFACSQVTPVGPERRDFQNRVPPVAEYALWTPNGTVNVVSGPDKRIRRPFFYRPGMMTLTWSAVGDVGEVAALLAHVSAIGKLRGHGWGAVARWSIETQGVVAEDYSSPRIRHVPAERPPVMTGLGMVTCRRLPLLPPYWRREAAVACWQEVTCEAR